MHQPATLNWALGEYVMESVIRAGGRSTVYTARRRGCDELRALKVVTIGSEPGMRAIVDAERRGAELQQEFARHHGLVPWVEEIGETRSCLYVAMELVPGEDLFDALTRGPLPVDRALDIAVQIATFLERTHRFDVPGRAPERIIHADLKPGNVRLRPDGAICVLDFGIAKAMAERRMETTQKWGTRQYMSPEWLHSGTIDEQVDYWSLGVLLYEMLAGYRPFRRFEKQDNLFEEAIRRRERAESLPPHVALNVQQVVGRLLAPQTAMRYASASEIRQALETCGVNGRPIRAAVAPPARHVNGGSAPDVVLPPLPPLPHAAPLDTPTERAVGGTITSATPGGDVPTERVPVPAVDLPTERVMRSSALSTRVDVPTAPVPPLPPLPATTLPADVASAAAATSARPLSRKARLRKALVTGFWIVFATILASEGIACIAAERLRSDAAVANERELDTAITRRAQLAGWTLFDAALHVRADPVLRDRLVSLADIVIADYRQEQPTVGAAEWEQARGWLTHAVGLYPTSRRLRSKLVYVEGHLQRLIATRRAEGRQTTTARQGYYTAIQKFREAAALDPQSPDPYLGLAQAYVYGLGEVDNAVEAQNVAQRLGYRPTRRQRAQLGDGYRTRGERVMRSARDLNGDQQREALERAEKDFKRCVETFTPIVEFANAADQLHRCESRLAEIETKTTPWWRRLFEPDFDTGEPR